MLQEAYDELLPKAKSWNRDRVLLAWGFGTAIVLTAGFEIYGWLFEKYGADFSKLVEGFPDYYLMGLFIIFMIGAYLAIHTSYIINQNADDINKTTAVIEKEIERIRKHKKV